MTSNGPGGPAARIAGWKTAVGFAALTAALTLLPAGPALSAGGGPTAVAALGPLVPAHHPLRRFEGSVKWYAFADPPRVGYEQPDFEAWVATLDEAAADPGAERFIAVWRDAAGAIRFVLTKAPHVRLYSIDGDTLEFEDPGFQTQVGVARWGWVYEDGLLSEHRTWRFAVEPPGERGMPVGPPKPIALYSLIAYEYGRGAKVPSRSRTYWSEADYHAERWGQKTTYDARGRRKKTKHNPERPYPH